MKLQTLIKRLERFYASKASSGARIKYFRRQGMKIGDKCRIETMSFSTEPYLVELGNGVGIATGTIFITHDAGVSCFKKDMPGYDIFGKIVIGDNVFIGANCTLLPNTRVGNNCIIGAGSVLRGKYPDNSVVFGNPAKPVMKMSVLKLLYSKSPGLLKTAVLSDAEKKPIVLEHFNNLSST